MLKYNTYPRALEHLRQVSCWVNANEMKHPLNPKTLHGASNKWPNSWGTYDQCYANLGRTNDRNEKIIGLGLELTPATLNAIDLDHVIADDGSIDEDALAIVRMMNTYTERSMSGHGLHLFFTGSVPDGHACKVIANDRSRELYSGEHFILTSFDVLPGYEEIRDCTAVIPMVYEQYYKPYEGNTVKKRQPRNKQPREPKQDTATIGNEFYNLTPLAEAIVRRDADFIRNTLRPDKKQFDNAADLFRYIYSYPLDKYLGLDGKQFCCFFHPDAHPSASTYRTGSHMGKRWVYHCSADNLTLTIKGVVELLGKFDSEYLSTEFIKDSLNIELTENEWTEQQRKDIDEILYRLDAVGEDSFKAIFPDTFGNCRHGLDIYRAILHHAKRNIYPVKYYSTSAIIFPMALSSIMRETNRGSTGRVDQWVKMLATHRLLYIMPDNLIPKDALAKARRIQKENGCTRRIQFYMILPQAAREVLKIQRRGKECKEYHYTAKAMSYELIMRTEGKDEADRLFPQRCKGADADGRLVKTMSRKGNARAEARHERIHTICVELLQEQGYFTMPQVIERYGSKSWSEVQAKRSIPEICAMYGLVRKKAGKELKKRYGIFSLGYPTIYYIE